MPLSKAPRSGRFFCFLWRFLEKRCPHRRLWPDGPCRGHLLSGGVLAGFWLYSGSILVAYTSSILVVFWLILLAFCSCSGVPVEVRKSPAAFGRGPEWRNRVPAEARSRLGSQAVAPEWPKCGRSHASRDFRGLRKHSLASTVIGNRLARRFPVHG